MDAFERLAVLELINASLRHAAHGVVTGPPLIRLSALERRTLRGMVNRSLGGRP